MRPFAVTGVHDLDAYLHAELLLAVSPVCSVTPILAKTNRSLLTGINTRASPPRTPCHSHFQDLPLTIRPKRQYPHISIRAILLVSSGRRRVHRRYEG